MKKLFGGFTTTPSPWHCPRPSGGTYSSGQTPSKKNNVPIFILNYPLNSTRKTHRKDVSFDYVSSDDIVVHTVVWQ